MVIKCVVSRCNFNYDKDKKTTASLFGFPKHDFDTERRRKQILTVTRNNRKACEKYPIFICKKHFRPEDIVSKSKESNTPQKRKENQLSSKIKDTARLPFHVLDLALAPTSQIQQHVGLSHVQQIYLEPKMCSNTKKKYKEKELKEKPGICLKNQTKRTTS